MLHIVNRAPGARHGIWRVDSTDGGFYYRNPNDREGVYTSGG